MNPRTLKIIAFILVGLSLLLAYAGFRMSQQAPVPQQVQTGPEMPYQVVVAARDIDPNETLEADDLQLIPYPLATSGSYDKIEDVLDQQTHAAISQGEMIRDYHFQGESLLSAQVSPGFRAMAVTVDETVGTGGFLKPGDRVDVVFSSRANKETSNRSVARRILNNIKVLAFGSFISGIDIEEDANGKRSRTAVLEVHEEDISKLLLAETTGVLRLVALGDNDAQTQLAGSEPTAESKTATVPDLTGWKGQRTTHATVYVYSGDSVKTIRTTP